MTFVNKNTDKYQTSASIHKKDKRQKINFAFSKPSFNSKWSFLFLNKNI
jgi:hypothetical protein